MNIKGNVGLIQWNTYYPKTQGNQSSIKNMFKSQLIQGGVYSAVDIHSTQKGERVPGDEFDEQVDAIVFVPKYQSQGGGVLTEEQIRDLTQRYNVKNMSDRELRCLMLELNNMGILSTEDATNSERREVEVNFNDCKVELVTKDSLYYDYFDKLSYFTKLAERDRVEGNSMAASHARITKILEMLTYK